MERSHAGSANCGICTFSQATARPVQINFHFCIFAEGEGNKLAIDEAMQNIHVFVIVSGSVLLSKLSVKVLDHPSDSLLLSKFRICIQTTSKEKYTFKRLHDVTLFYKVHISSKEAQISLVNTVVCLVGLLCRYFLRKTDRFKFAPNSFSRKTQLELTIKNLTLNFSITVQKQLEMQRCVI